MLFNNGVKFRIEFLILNSTRDKFNLKVFDTFRFLLNYIMNFFEFQILFKENKFFHNLVKENKIR